VSQIATYRTEIRLTGPAREGHPEADPGYELLRQAVAAVAEEHDGRLGDHIEDYFGRRMDCDFAAATPACPRGVGVKVAADTGEVAFLVDPYGGLEETARRLIQEIEQNYVALAVAQALRDLNYQVDVGERRSSDPDRRAIVVRGSL